MVGRPNQIRQHHLGGTLVMTMMPMGPARPNWVMGAVTRLNNMSLMNVRMLTVMMVTGMTIAYEGRWCFQQNVWHMWLS